MMLQTNISDKNTYKTIIASEGIDTIKLIQSEILLAYGQEHKTLPIVAISDGASSIKNVNKDIFGQEKT